MRIKNCAFVEHNQVSEMFNVIILGLMLQVSMNLISSVPVEVTVVWCLCVRLGYYQQ